MVVGLCFVHRYGTKLKIYIAIVGKTISDAKSFIDKLKQEIISIIERI